MTSRQRFYETMNFGISDRVPYFEEGIRKEVLEHWYKQGLSRNQNLFDLFPTDHFEEIQLNINPLPEINNWPTSYEELSLLNERLNPNNQERFPINWEQIVSRTSKKDKAVFLRVHRGFFQSMGIYKWDRFSEVMYMLLEKPEFVHQAMAIHGEFVANFFDRVLSEIKVDAAIFTEPIGGNEGPLISPEMYEEFALRSYRPLLDVLHKYGISTIIIRTYANSRILIPILVENGFNCLWACETNIQAMDYRELRKEFGHELRLIGGIDLDALRYGKEAIHYEIEEKVPPLIADGGYIPLADGRIRKDISFENYLYYRKLLEKVIDRVS